MKPRFCTPITNAEARHFLRAHFDGVRIPRGSRAVWVSGVHWVTDQPGVYLIGAAGGMCGVQVTKPVIEGEARVA